MTVIVFDLPNCSRAMCLEAIFETRKAALSRGPETAEVRRTSAVQSLTDKET